ncbi:MAG TPA: hypothetical protein DIT07_15115 [Sphingobacteriaceae bacterium]|nr:hypothetical protein [Sphingobacteriaceae bacterium]
MKKINLFKITFLLSCVISASTSFAQGDVAELLKSSPADATKLANAYLSPLFTGFGIGLNSGWNNSADTKKVGRFEIRVSASGAIVPTSAKTFDVTKIGLSSNVSVASGGNIAPTIGAGNNVSAPVLNVKDSGGNTLESFQLPSGAGLPFIPGPQVQATVGLPKYIDVTLRLMPKTKIGDNIGEIGMFGGGVKVDVLRMLNKTAEKILPFSLAVAVGYTQFTYELGLDVQPPSGSVPKTASDVKDFSTQKISAKFSGTNVDAIISKNLLFFTPFFSVGYSTSKTDVGLDGNYPIISSGVSGGGGTIIKQYSTFTDPISINQTDVSGLHTNIGFKMNLTILKIFGSYSMAKYNSFNAGIGLGIGK